VADLARLGDAVVLLVVVVVLPDVLVGDLDLLGHLLVDLLGDQLVLDLLADLLLGEALLLEVLRVLGLVAAEVLLRHLLEPGVDLLVADLDVELVGGLAILRLLDEVLHGLVLERLVLRRPGLREVALLLLERLLGAPHQRVELGLRDLLVADDGDGAVRHALVAAAATHGEAEQGENEGEYVQFLHREAARAHAASRASRIASVRPTAAGNSSVLSEISRLAVV
jgi:hypothetical protein